GGEVVSADDGGEALTEEELALIVAQLLAAGMSGASQAIAAEPISGEGQPTAGTAAVQAAAGQGAPAQPEGGAGLLAAPQSEVLPVQAGDEDTENVVQRFEPAGIPSEETAQGAPVLSGADEAAAADGAPLMAAAPEMDEGQAPGKAGAAPAGRAADPANPEAAELPSGAFADESSSDEVGARVAAVAEEGAGEVDGQVKPVAWAPWAEEGADALDESSEPGPKAAQAALAAGEGGFGDSPADSPVEDAKIRAVAGRSEEAPAAANAPKTDAAAPSPASSRGVDAVLRAEVQRQFMEAALSRLQLAVRDGVATGRLQLDPPALGHLQMDIRVESGAMHAKLTVETPWAREAVMSGLRELRESLARQGLSLGQFSVDVRADLNAGNFAQDRAGGQGEGALYLEAVPDDEAPSPYAGAAPAYAAWSRPGERSINIFA
ncbi:MAG: flagellar hook-length control protein FliK, partial [Nitrospinota bacterium]